MKARWGCVGARKKNHKKKKNNHNRKYIIRKEKKRRKKTTVADGGTLRMRCAQRKNQKKKEGKKDHRCRWRHVEDALGPAMLFRTSTRIHEVSLMKKKIQINIKQKSQIDFLENQNKLVFKKIKNKKNYQLWTRYQWFKDEKIKIKIKNEIDFQKSALSSFYIVQHG